MMKNLLLLGLAFTASLGAANAQRANLRPKNPQAAVKLAGQGGEALLNAKSNPGNTTVAPVKNKRVMPGAWGTQIGHTYYDLPSNGATANRIVRNSDGTLSVSWNETCDPNTSAAGFPNRGAGYNYFNGTSWINGPTGTCTTPEKNFGVASKRIGWPEVVVLPNGKEMIFSHNSTAVNLTERPAKGTGGMATWTATNDLAFTANIQGAGNAGTWPRAVAVQAPAAGQEDDIHLIYSANHASSTGAVPVPVINGVANPFVYSRSLDGGVTWDKQNIILPDLNGVVAGDNSSFTNDNYRSIGGDDYAIAARNGVVAVVAGSGGDPWTLWKSTDNGNTWTRRIIKSISPVDTIHLAADTAAYTNDSGHAIVIDNNGQVHVFGGMILAGIDVKAKPAGAGGGTYFRAAGSSYTSGDVPNYGLLYWNESYPATINSIFDLRIAEVEDAQPTGSPTDWVGTGIGPPSKRFPYSGLGIVSMASAAVDAANNIYVVFSGVVEGTSDIGGPDGQPFRDLYIKKRFATGARAGKWSSTYNIARSLSAGGAPGVSSAENFEENVFPSVAHVVGADNKVHIVWQADFLPGMHLGSDVDAESENFIMYYAFNGLLLDATVGVNENLAAFVNNISAFPNPTTDNVTINVDLKKNANVSVRVTNIMGQEVANIAPKQMAAGNSQVKIDMNGLANGVYLYTVTSDNFTVTNRIVKQ